MSKYDPKDLKVQYAENAMQIENMEAAIIQLKEQQMAIRQELIKLHEAAQEEAAKESEDETQEDEE